MALTNFSLPYATPSPFLYGGNDGQSVINNLRFNAVLPPSSAAVFKDDRQYRNDPYSRYQPSSQQQPQQQRFRHVPQTRGQEVFTGIASSQSSSRSYASQEARYAAYDVNFQRSQSQDQLYQQPSFQQQQQQHQQQQQQHQQPNYQHQSKLPYQNQENQQKQPLYQEQNQQRQQSYQEQNQQKQQLYQEQNQQTQQSYQSENQHLPLLQKQRQFDQLQRVPTQVGKDQLQVTTNPRDQSQENYPERPNGYTRVNSGSFIGPGAKTSVHAVLDYDDDELEDYYDDGNLEIPSDAHVTPIQGPIFVKNGSVPVVPLYSYPQLNNGTLVQIPILWTALSVALGVELRGDLIKGAPCIKRYHQLFCPTAGNSYPIGRIEQFIDENKALMKRMYGDFEMNEFSPPKKDSSNRRKRTSKNQDIPDGGPRFQDNFKSKPHAGSGDSYFSKIRSPRQSFGKVHPTNESGRVDACESKVEIVTPYWSTNSAGKVRAIVNTQHFEQAIHQEVCSKSQTGRCTGDCGCEQKYKWHRLLAYDPDNDCKGIFMDWFLYPSCCVCRCDPTDKFPPTTTSRN